MSFVRRIFAAALAAASLFAPVRAADAPAGCVPEAAPVQADGQPRVSDAQAPYTRPEADVPPNKRTLAGLYLTSRDAYDMVREDPAAVVFIDVRTRGELQFIGMPALVDAHVPYLVEREPPVWDAAASTFALARNPDFVRAVGRAAARKGLDASATVILICQAGMRSARAADELTRAGWRGVYVVTDGFEGDPLPDGPRRGERLRDGWRNAGLPWTTRLERGKMYGLD